MSSDSSSAASVAETNHNYVISRRNYPHIVMAFWIRNLKLPFFAIGISRERDCRGVGLQVDVDRREPRVR